MHKSFSLEIITVSAVIFISNQVIPQCSFQNFLYVPFFHSLPIASLTYFTITFTSFHSQFQLEYYIPPLAPSMRFCLFLNCTGSVVAADSLLFDITLFSKVQGVISSRVVFAKKISKATSSSRISQLHHESIA